jgi:opacity protein-like surface antigen
MKNCAVLASCAVIAVLLHTPPTAAQSSGAWTFGAAASASLWVGEGDALDGSWGVDGTAWRRLGSHLGARADVMLMPLEASSAPFESADNRLLVLGVGPEVDVGFGAAAVYGRALAGIAINQQIRSGSASEERTSTASTLGGGAGLRLEVSRAVGLDVGADILSVGELDFARTSASGGVLSTGSAVLRLRAGLRIGVP